MGFSLILSRNKNWKKTANYLIYKNKLRHDSFHRLSQEAKDQITMA